MTRADRIVHLFEEEQLQLETKAALLEHGDWSRLCLVTLFDEIILSKGLKTHGTTLAGYGRPTRIGVGLVLAPEHAGTSRVVNGGNVQAG
jgi:hypothetical protein